MGERFTSIKVVLCTPNPCIGRTGSSSRTLQGPVYRQTLRPGPYARPAGMRSSRWLTASDQLRKVIVHAGHAEVGLAQEWPANVVDPVAVVAGELDNREDIVVWLVQRVQNLVAGDGDRGSPGDTALDFEEAQLSGAGHLTLDVVTELVEFAIT